MAAVGKNKISDHVDEYYCLASVKGVKTFASAFSQNIILISQDDKAKVYVYYYFINILIVRINRFFWIAGKKIFKNVNKEFIKNK